jgi:hypothetical protein
VDGAQGRGSRDVARSPTFREPAVAREASLVGEWTRIVEDLLKE